MAERATSKRRPTRQAVAELVSEAEKTVAERKQAEANIQEIAVRAIEGSASSKQLANLQQLLADQVRKTASPER